MRAIWKGAISFGLVNIPVGLYPATRAGDEVKFHLLRRKDLSPIKYKRVAEADGEEVPWEDIVKGYEYAAGHYVVLTPEDFERVKIDTKQTVAIREFVNVGEIDPMFFDVPYYLAPEKGGAKAYVILREALRNTKKVGIAKVVLKTREHLAAVKPVGDGLVLEMMHFAGELLDAAELKLPAPAAVGEKELTMAESLIQSMLKVWEPAKYQDDYREGLMEVIQEKIAAGGQELPPRKAKRRPAATVSDLVAVLQQSLEQFKSEAKGSGRKRTKAA